MCGVFGIWGHPEAANMTYLGLHALQHRGQESAGIVSTDGSQLFAHRSMGLVQNAFGERELSRLKGFGAIGHVRYSTAGSSHIKDAQPIAVDYALGSMALAHNGNLTNHEVLRAELEAEGSIFQSSADTETIVHLVARSHGASIEHRIAESLRSVEGAYSLVFLCEKQLIALRDPRGIRPLVLGVMKRADRTVHLVASEPTSFELIGAELVRELLPGEMLTIDDQGIRSSFPFEEVPRAMCLFEYIYFARPDAVIDGANVYEVRKELGRRLAIEHPLPSDAVIVPVPDSGVPAAIGLSEASGLPFQMGLIRSHYIGRTFIEPQDSIRHFGVRLKLHPNRAVLEGRKVVVVDDSIVRGTTSRKIVKMIRDAGAEEVHVRVSSPPNHWPCHYGIATPNREELLAANLDMPAIARYLEADSLGYLSLEALVSSVRSLENRARDDGSSRISSPPTSQPIKGFCHACFSGDYPIPIRRKAEERLRIVGTESSRAN